MAEERLSTGLRALDGHLRLAQRSETRGQPLKVTDTQGKNRRTRNLSMNTKMFINLPVADLPRALAFFQGAWLLE